MFRASAVAFVVAAALPAAAQQDLSPSAGTITGTLQLDDAVWHVVAGDGPDGSGWTATETGREVRIVGAPRESIAGTPVDTLHVSFTAAGNPTEPVVKDARVEFRAAGEDAVWVAEQPNVLVEVNAIEVGGGEMAIAGDIVARMTPGGSDNLVIDTDDLVTFDGNFQATLQQTGAF